MGSELARGYLQTHDTRIAPHLHHAVAIIKDSDQPLTVVDQHGVEPLLLQYVIRRIVAFSSHRKYAAGLQLPRIEARVLAQPFNGLRADFVAASREDPYVGTQAQHLQDAEHGRVRQILVTSCVETTPLVSRVRFQQVLPVVSQCQSAVQVKDVEGSHAENFRIFFESECEKVKECRDEALRGLERSLFERPREALLPSLQKEGG